MMEIQKFIESHDNWETLLAEPPYSLSIKKEDDFVMFNYNLINSDMTIPLVRECRGLILDKGNWKVVCRGMDKFSNAHESDSDLDKIDWQTARIQEKVDGTLIFVWNYEGEWHVSTRSTIDAHNAPLNVGGFETFYDLFVDAVLKKFDFIDDFFDTLAPTFTYWFELVSPYNRIVVPYDETKLYFLGWRWKRSDMHELYPEDSAMANYFDTPKTYPLYSFNEVCAAAEKMGWDEEGFVVCDAQFHRIKVKSPMWVAAHYIVNNGVQTDERLVDIIRSGESDEFCEYCPQYSARLREIQSFMEEYARDAEAYAHAYIYMVKEQNLTRSEYALRAKRDNDWCFDYLMWAFTQVYGNSHGYIGDGDYSFKKYDELNLRSKDWVRTYKRERG